MLVALDRFWREFLRVINNEIEILRIKAIFFESFKQALTDTKKCKHLCVEQKKQIRNLLLFCQKKKKI